METEIIELSNGDRNYKKSGATKCAQLLTLIGDEGLRIFNSFVVADDKKDDFDELLRLFEEYFTPKKNLTYERNKFLNYKQKAGQSVENYVTELKNMALGCEFGDLKDELIKDIMVCGLKSESVREKILQNDVKSLDDALRICVATENARDRNREITNGHGFRNQEVFNAVDEVRRKYVGKPTPSRSKDFRRSNKPLASRVVCGKCSYQHQHGRCPAYGKTCNGCSKLHNFLMFVNLKLIDLRVTSQISELIM